jgi:carboxymethylenebutenolidase
MAKLATAITPKELREGWQQHVYFEFVKKNATAALGTTSDNPHVFMVPLAIGGRGREGVYNFYHNCFLAQPPADITSIPISQVIGENILTEEAVYQFTHDQVMDWLVPGVPPTGKHVEVGVVAIITFKNGKIASEHVRGSRQRVGPVGCSRSLKSPGQRQRKPSHLAAVGRSSAGTKMM